MWARSIWTFQKKYSHQISTINNFHWNFFFFHWVINPPSTIEFFIQDGNSSFSRLFRHKRGNATSITSLQAVSWDASKSWFSRRPCNKKSKQVAVCWWLEIEWRRLSTISSVCCEQVAKQQSDLSVLLFSAKRYGKWFLF